MSNNPNSTPSYELTDEQRDAAEHLRDSDNPLAPIAAMLVQLDDNASSTESTSASSISLAS